ncbi:BREX system Lon protease-like protein BrxL [Cuspidothrix issatschenkoi]|jgi:ATP-dependent Lon protease|uniref:BREX system Lon protease-like protein BrxL n=1 Tax=Cuspidothrix issatschenkoi CHARLIE-1 TaxID=2052836 RepID=A0A2S6CPV2_9CYAN|nr:BREX system Lon protease-like protein BrxL [Cuspidothrix issatschenkoi]PPJ61670.1 BREX system Lon protease-like protein BrxL [Cuspidothrix issatschenkoi CHARLIE-1]
MTFNYKNDLVQQVFQIYSFDKKRLKGLTNLGIPSFVLEWLIDKKVPGTGILNDAELAIINDFVQKAFPRKDDQEVIKFKLIQGQIHKLIALLKVRIKLEANSKQIPEPLANIEILNLSNCEITSDIVDKYKRLLRQGVWGKITLRLKSNIDGNFKVSVIDFDPFQSSEVDLQEYAQFRSHFTTEQWRDLMFCSMGYNPEHPTYNHLAKTRMLTRLIPLVESNYHIMELAPKGTGKSFVYENINNKVSVISGGKITPAKLFIDGKTQSVGLLGRYDVVVLDEIQSLTFDKPDEVIGPLKTYLANGRYNRSGFSDNPISSDCSLVLLGNIELDEDQRPKHRFNLMKNLPRFFSETAFLDRFAGILPGWEIPKFQRDMIADQIGLKMDFFGEALLSLRRDNRFYQYAQEHTQFDDNITVRDQEAILKTASGFLKILYPHLQLTLQDYQRDCLEPAKEIRQQIRNIQYNLDDEFKKYGKDIYVDIK